MNSPTSLKMLAATLLLAMTVPACAVESGSGDESDSDDSVSEAQGALGSSCTAQLSAPTYSSEYQLISKGTVSCPTAASGFSLILESNIQGEWVRESSVSVSGSSNRVSWTRSLSITTNGVYQQNELFGKGQFRVRVSAIKRFGFTSPISSFFVGGG